MNLNVAHAAIAAVLFVAATGLSAQAIPRMADGRPDLSGTYDVATLTPFERPIGKFSSDKLGRLLPASPPIKITLANKTEIQSRSCPICNY